MKRLIIGLVLAMMLTLAVAVPASAHNVGHVDTPVGCADVGGGNSPPEGGSDGHARGVHHASHAGQDRSAIDLGTCSS